MVACGMDQWEQEVISWEGGNRQWEENGQWVRGHALEGGSVKVGGKWRCVAVGGWVCGKQVGQ